MITGELRSKIDRIWDDFWSGSISNPLTVVEQITYLLFIKRLDEIHTARELKANITGKPITGPVFPADRSGLRWSRFKDMEAGEMYDNMVNDVFPFLKNLQSGTDRAYTRFMKDAVFIIPTPQLLERVVTKLTELPMENRDLKGDIYEYLLAKISTAGKNGQFRTPHHIIRMMVHLVKPGPEDIVCDPASW
jgi:type I restriction enzyme M protein